jgi:cell division protein FtsL
MIINGWVCGMQGVILSQSASHLILMLLAILVIVCAIIIYFSLKLKRVNQELLESNKHISDINTDLEKSNLELADRRRN